MVCPNAENRSSRTGTTMATLEDRPAKGGTVVGCAFFILGLGTLLPWNFFMTASQYFERRLDQVNTDSSLEWSNSTVTVRKEYYFNNWMTLLSQLPLLLFTLLNSILYQRISEKVRIAGSLVFIFLLFVVTAVLVKIPMKEDRFFSITMATIWFINSFGAVLQGSLFGLVGLLPERYNSIFMSGQGLAGTFAAVAMLFAIASKTDEETAALGYFITPCVGTLITFLSYLSLPYMEFAQFHLNKNKTYEVENGNELLFQETCNTESGETQGLDKPVITNGAVQVAPPDPEPGSAETRQALLALESAATKRQDKEKSSVMEVFKKIWVMAFCVTFAFTVTLSVFPAVTVDVKTVYSGPWEQYFVPVCCFLTFNVMDWLGRTLTSFVQWPPKESRLFPFLVVARVVFVPLLMVCNVQKRAYLPVLLSHDAAFVVIMMLFSLSSGYCVCLSMSYAPRLVDPKDGETTGAVMTFFLALGLSLGAAFSFLLRTLV